ncbi:MAG: DinB family protein [Gemmatimonadetes bacterium]|nr:DinB family protein [Gemmatimonadota bacterium]
MRKLIAALSLALVFAAPVAAQGVMADMHTDLNDTEKKFVDLANAIPESAYDWRPAPGVRSIREVLLHVVSDNYLLPIMMGKPAPASSGITSDFNTATAFEKRPMTRAQIAAELHASFLHLHQALALTTDANLSATVKMFGQDFTRHRASLLAITHLHEHLGQFIAYARSNNVTPPWSR